VTQFGNFDIGEEEALFFETIIMDDRNRSITIRQALKQAGAELSPADTRLLLAHILSCDSEFFFREPERLLDAGDLDRFQALVARRAAGEPLQHITGVQEFWSMEFRADGRALIPRPETEHLVEAALERIPADTSINVLDLCTGSGIIAAVLARERPRSSITATDISPEALALAAENLQSLGLEGRVDLVQGDLFRPLGQPGPAFHLITANPPYISESELAGLDREVRDHEPLAALDGGADGFTVVRRIIVEAAGWLYPGGWLLMEVGAGQWGTVEKIALDAGCWGKPSWARDLAGYRRILCLPLG
jgi:release factor glutamine methyltransferase